MSISYSSNPSFAYKQKSKQNIAHNRIWAAVINFFYVHDSKVVQFPLKILTEYSDTCGSLGIKDQLEIDIERGICFCSV